MKTKFLFFGLLLFAICLFPDLQASAAVNDDNPLSGNDWLFRVEGESGEAIVKNLAFELLPLFKYIFTGIVLIFWTVYILLFITAFGNEEKISNQRKNLLYSLIGFALISLAELMSEAFMPQKDALIDEEATTDILLRVITYMQVAIGAIAMIMLFYASFKMITAQGEEDEVGSAKKMFLWSTVGFIVSMVSRPLVETVFYPESRQLGGDSVAALGTQVGGALSFILGFLAVLATVAIIIAGFYFATSFSGDEEQHEKAKTILINTSIGLVIILSAYTIVRIFVPS